MKDQILPIAFVLFSILVVFFTLGGERVRGWFVIAADHLVAVLYRIGQAALALGIFAGVVYLVVRVARLAWGSP